ncbi:MAG: 1-(5-phosphoribosyl)-5-[(5-phosphoribosylamino)methylideneamino]imidazole-4-carboxamide isomerase [Bdellovibrionales bacterium]
MEIFPAIDLKEGRCVRLRQGNFNEATIYEADPVKQAKRFESEGAKQLHIVDLDGAKDGTARQTALIKNIVQSTALSVQTGGGIREKSDIESLLDCGIKRVVIGSLCITAPQKVQDWIGAFGKERIVLALDIRLNAQKEPILLTRGWQDESTQTLWDILNIYNTQAETILCTDVDRDGMLSGPNVALYDEIKKRFPTLSILASGGIGALEDIKELTTLGVAGAITGKALYENKFSLADALKETAHAC